MSELESIPKTPSDPAEPSDQTVPSEPAGVQLGRLAMTITLVLCVFGAIFLFFGVMDGAAMIREWTTPPLATAKGTIKISGEPLPHGQLLTLPVGSRGRGSMGIIDSEGNFVLKTDVKGTFVDGAQIGKHKVVVQAQQRGVAVGAAQPPSMVAAKYTSFETTPLIVEVTSDPTQNVFNLIVEPNERRAPPPQSSPQEPDSQTAEK